MAGAVLSHGRDFSQRKSIDRRVHFAKSSLELRNRKIDLSKTGIVNIENCKAGMIFGKAAMREFLQSSGNGLPLVSGAQINAAIPTR